MKLKKIPYYLLLLLLTFGASLIIGLLSFSGMFTLMPLISVALLAFGLSVAYEGEIYLQNIKGALNKLFFKSDYLKHHLTEQYLLKKFTDKTIDTQAEDCPQFFKDYEAQLHMLDAFGHKRLDKASRQQKKQVKKTLRDMEKWFAIQLFASTEEEDLTEYETSLRKWLQENGGDDWKKLLNQRQITYHFVKGFSLLAGVFMGFGITYLLVEAFAVIPLLAMISPGLLPVFIVPMAIMAGIAYGLLIYNAVTDMINNDTLRTWYRKIRGYLAEGFTVRNVSIAIAAVVLLALTIALTVCTAGTWWTIAKTARPLFGWMGQMPSFIMGVVNPIVTGFSQLIFNLENTSESLALIDDATKSKKNIFRKIGKAITHTYKHVMETENWLQRINPARILLKITVTPIRILLFLGHLISIGVTADRVPGIPEIVSALLGIISEGFEDAHYFLADLLHDEHEHGHAHSTQELVAERFGAAHGHDHSDDIPTRTLQFLFSPLYFLAAAWDSWASTGNPGDARKELTFGQAWDKQRGLPDIESVTLDTEGMDKAHEDWQIHHADYKIKRHIEKHLQGTFVVGKKVAEEKIGHLEALRSDLRHLNKEERETFKDRIKESAAENKAIYGQHRFFNNENNTRTHDFLESLPTHISAPAA